MIPVLPESGPIGCLWCTGGPPDTLRLAGSGLVDGIPSVWVAENADGTGRRIVIQRDPAETAPDTVCLEPAHSVVDGVRGWALPDDELALRFTDDVGTADIDGWLRLRLTVKPAVTRELRSGLQRLKLSR